MVETRKLSKISGLKRECEIKVLISQVLITPVSEWVINTADTVGRGLNEKTAANRINCFVYKCVIEPPSVLPCA